MHPFTERPDDSVSAWGEEKLIAAIRTWLGSASPRAPFGIGDDCAVLKASRGVQLITVDPVIYGRHFDDSVPPRAVGEKLLKRNLSDLAAMGGRPVAAVLALSLDARVSRCWLASFYRGLASASKKYRVQVVGGDIAEARGLAASLTLLGEASGRRVVTRTGARIGDAIYVTGQLGRSRETGHHYRFSPRLPEGSWLANEPHVHAMMDVSDGVAKDLHAITPPKAAPVIWAEHLPCRRGANVRAALTDGEDYELLFALSAKADAQKFSAAWRRKFPHTRLSCIGSFAPKNERPSGAVDLTSYHGYEHLR